jgi:ATP-binding cassette subfamily F protein 3
MLSISNLSYFIGERVLLDSAQLYIKPKEKIGLVGLNGAGKTTLLRIINGELTPDHGEVSRSNDCSIGYLNQDLLSFNSHESIVSVVMDAFQEAVGYERQIEQILKRLETDYSEKLLHRLTTLQERYEQLGGYTLQNQAEEILEGVGFATSDLHRQLSEFSGGWRMRVMLAKLLLEKPSLLMLDEPTNHLDLPSIQWVENYLRNYEGAVLIVSHDKYFLDNTIGRTVEVANGRLNTFSGNYSFYLQEKELRDDIQRNAYANQQQKIKQTEQFITRFRAKATKARQVQSKVKALERMEKIEDVRSESDAVSFNFHFSQQSGRHVATLMEVDKRYGEIEVLKDSSVALERGDKVALIGANGIGKSTLLRMIAGREPHSGKISVGYNVIQAFYAQHQIEALNLANEILDELKQSGTGKAEQEIRTLLGCFLFSGDDVFKKIKVLSGGEKSRVALAKTLLSEANFLLLDEPTNHLDIVSVNILIQALQQYKGSFILVSHDRFFISEVANKIWFIEDQAIKEYPGTYAEYAEWKSRRDLENTDPGPPQRKKPGQKKSPINSGKQTEKRDKLEREIKDIEREIEKLETEKMRLEQLMSDPATYGTIEKLSDATNQYEEVTQSLKSRNSAWEGLIEKLDAQQK